VQGAPYKDNPRRQKSVAGQKVAIGFRAEPFAPGTASGAAVSRNIHRGLRLASRPSNSRSQLSKKGTPMATNTSVWIGCATPSLTDGIAALAGGLPSLVASRDISHFAQVTSSPAEPLGCRPVF